MPNWVALYNGESGNGAYAIGAASSDDGLDWTRHSGNPVISAGTGWEADHVKDPCLIFDGSQYVVYYSGYNGTSYQIGRATAPSHEGPWTKDASNPVLALGTSGSFDDEGLSFPTVLYEESDTGKEWKMWYRGTAGGTVETIGYAYSSDGISWTKVGEVIGLGAGGTWNDVGVLPGAIVKSNDVYHLFVGGRQGTTNPRWQGGVWTFTDPEGTYTAEAGNPTLLARFNDANTSQVLTSGASAGASTIAVTTTAGLNVGEVIAIVANNTAAEIHRIESLAPTVITIEGTLSQTHAVLSGATVRSMAYNSVIARSVIELGDGSAWIFGTPFQPVEDLDVTGPNKLREGAYRWTAAALTAEADYDYDHGLLFPLYPSVSGTWDDVSAENPSVINTEEVPGDPGGGYEPSEPGKAILEIYVHDEDASRWGEATWATGPATGTEGIWSAAGWTDVTPEGVNVHWIWGSRRPSRGILHDQDGASVNIQTYDPDRVLDPGNPDSPYYPQLVPNLPVRVSHESLVIRTGLVEELTWSAKEPYWQGQMLGTDTIGPLHRAGVPADSILGDTLLERIQDAVNAAGISVGGIPLPPAGPSGPALSEYVEGAATDDDISVWEIIRKACQEVLWVPYVTADAGLGLRPWGSPLDRGREITATNLEDNKSTINEDGTYSVVSVQVADPDLDPIVRVAAPLPRYGRRMYERRETTIDPEGWAAAVLADRAWPGVQYIPGAIHCFTAADVNYFGSLETMERVTITVPGIVSVQGRILGGELWVEHRRGSDRGATWIFLFSVATDGSTAIGLDTLVSDQGGEPLVDDMTETDYLEAD